jgi:hypothetical protein
MNRLARAGAGAKIRVERFRLFCVRRGVRRLSHSSARAIDAAGVEPRISRNCGAGRRRQERKMSKGQRRGNREARKPKAAKALVAPPAVPFAVMGASVANQPTKTQALRPKGSGRR